jgi:Putative esterase
MKRRALWGRVLSGCLGLLLAGCAAQRPVVVPMASITLPASAQRTSSTLIVFMPGVQELPQDIVREGFVDQVRTRGIDADVVVVDAHLGYFTNGVFEQRLREDIVLPARARGYRSIWLAGISLGGFGALRYARAFPGDIDGVIALAPYVAPRLDLQEVWHAGGLLRWQPVEPPKPSQHERALLLWLKGYADPALRRPPLYIGYGDRDGLQPFAPLMAGILLPERLLSAPGGHDWPPWKAMWSDALDRVPWGMSKAPALR